MTNQLLPRHDGPIRESAFTPKVAAARGYRSITDQRDLEALGSKPYQCRVPALVMPVRGVDGDVVLHRKAIAKIVTLPAGWGGTKVGLADYLADSHGAEIPAGD